jgi:hypothetical protein
MVLTINAHYKSSTALRYIWENQKLCPCEHTYNNCALHLVPIGTSLGLCGTMEVVRHTLLALGFWSSGRELLLSDVTSWRKLLTMCSAESIVVTC